MLLKRPVRTRFRYGFPTRVNLATHRKLAGSFFKRHAVTRQAQVLARRSHGWQTVEERSHNPVYATPAGSHTHTVWPHPVSLATTPGITVVFSSCGY